MRLVLLRHQLAQMMSTTATSSCGKCVALTRNRLHGKALRISCGRWNRCERSGRRRPQGKIRLKSVVTASEGVIERRSMTFGQPAKPITWRVKCATWKCYSVPSGFDISSSESRISRFCKHGSVGRRYLGMRSTCELFLDVSMERKRSGRL